MQRFQRRDELGGADTQARPGRWRVARARRAAVRAKPGLQVCRPVGPDGTEDGDPLGRTKLGYGALSVSFAIALNGCTPFPASDEAEGCSHAGGLMERSGTLGTWTGPYRIAPERGRQNMPANVDSYATAMVGRPRRF